jgi:hypothetical protein
MTCNVSHPYTSNSVVHYLLDESLQGDNAIDTGPNALNMTALGSGPAVPIEGGKIGGARGPFNATDYFNVADNVVFRQSIFTLALWVNFLADAQINFVNFFDKRQPGTGATHSTWSLNTQGDGDTKIQFALRDNTGAVSTCNSDTVLNSSVWHHVVGTYDGINMRLYINGILEKTTPTGITFGYDAGVVEIGNTDRTDQQLNGYIDDVAMYNTAKPSAWVTNAYNLRHELHYNFVGGPSFFSNFVINTYDNLTEEVLKLDPDVICRNHVPFIFGHPFFRIIKKQ